MQEENARRTNQARTDATRAALVQAARALFVAEGFASTSTPAIVKAAGVTRGALYHHFADKTDLFRAVVEAEAGAVAAAIESESAASGGPLAALREGAAAYFRAMTEPGRTRLLLVEGPAVLGLAEMARIDQASGGGSLRDGLAAALPPGALGDAELSALADGLAAAFDRAALAIAEGAAPAPYERAVGLMVEGAVRALGG